ncbi:metal ABC transporter substrate-binding protein [Spirochaetia bacterium]|nr:metal ABC transporter substrate-binding protein [Spirochaetia bacterium]
MKSTAKKIIAAAFAAMIAVSPVMAGGKTDGDDGVKVVKVGVTSDDPRLWDAVQAELDARGKRIKIQTVYFDGGGRVNQSTADNELDLNAFQHYAFYNLNAKELKLEDQLTPVAETLIVPLNLFSNRDKNYRTPSELPNGASIIIPDDPTNEGRALSLLESAGLIKINPAVGLNGQPKDIISNPKNLKFIEIFGPQIPRSLPDADAGVINAGIAVDAGFDLNTDAIFKLDIDATNPSLKPFFNIIVAKTRDKDAQWVADIREAYYTKRVADAIGVIYKNAAIPVFKY